MSIKQLINFRWFRLILLASLIVTLCHVDAVAHERKLLVEVFTNSFCPICPRYIPPVQDAIEEEFEDFIFIQYHTWWPGNEDPWYMENYERHLPAEDDIRTRIFWMEYDQFMGVPSFFFDGHRIRYGGTIVENSVDYVSERLQEETPLQIGIEALAYEDTLLTRVSITSDEILSNLTLFMALCEREVEYNAPSGQRRFTGNVLDLFPDGEGYRFSIVRDFEVIYECESPLNVGWHVNELDNLQVVAWVQRRDLEILQSVSVAIEILKAPEEQLPMPVEIGLDAAYPNPFNSQVNIPYSLDRTGYVQLTVHDLSGREVARPVDGECFAGRHIVSFDADRAGLANGIYYVRLVSDGRVDTQKIIYLR